MRQFHVPQFITVEDKVIGPFTIKQFLYLGGGALLILGAQAFLEAFLFFPLSALIGSISLSLAFLKINGRPLPVILKNAVSYYFLRPRLYVWRKEEKAGPAKKTKEEIAAEEKGPLQALAKLSRPKLADLAWSLDIKEKIRE